MIFNGGHPQHLFGGDIQGDEEAGHYGDHSGEAFVPFQHLMSLHLGALLQIYMSSSLFESLLSSPCLEHVHLSHVPNLTDHVIRDVLNHEHAGEQRCSFQTLYTLTLTGCEYITSSIQELLDTTEMPLDNVNISRCYNVQYLTPSTSH